MPRKHSYAIEKLHSTIYSLATGPGDIRERLSNVKTTFVVLKTNHFPKSLQTDWIWIKKEITKFGPTYDYKGKVDLVL